MIVAVAATQMELAPFLAAAEAEGRSWPHLCTGVGVLETMAILGDYLARNHRQCSAVLQFGVGGGYPAGPGAEGAMVLDVCLAASEVFGDFGICHADRVEYFDASLAAAPRLELTSPLLDRAEELLANRGIACRRGHFISVNGVSATTARGCMLRDRWQGICENMEGVAAARLCQRYELPLVELRVISNLVEDRSVTNWQLAQACHRAGELAALLIKELA